MILFSPILILLISAIFCLLFWSKPHTQKKITLTASVLYLISALALFYLVNNEGIQAVQAGDWPAPFGITFVADTFSALMVLITAILSFASIIYSLQDMDRNRKSRGFYSIFLFLILGVTGSFLTGDVFNLYVWFEVMLMASFVLISLGSSKSQLVGSVKYVVLNFIASCFFLAGVGLLYKITGTLNMASLAEITKHSDESGFITLSAIFFFMGFGIKSALFPLFFWLPASYHTPPIAISGLMAGLLTKVGVYAMIRFFSLIFVNNIEFTHSLLLLVSGFTMLVGVLGAIAQNDFRKILSFHIISQIGYMTMGLAIFTPLALAGSVFYIIHHIIVKANLFFISGITGLVGGSFDLKKSGGFYDHFPFIALLFVISAFSLAGLPPLSGFWGKFILVKAGLEAQQPIIVAVSLLVGLLTLLSMTKIWSAVFWPESQEKNPMEMTQKELFRIKYLMILPVILLAAITISIGIFPSFLMDISFKAADQLLNPQEYINAVLNKM